MVGTRQRNTAGLFSVNYRVDLETDFTSTGEETDEIGMALFGFGP